MEQGARVAVVRRFDFIETGLALETMPLRAPARGEVQVGVAAVGVSYVDALTAQGRHQQVPELPWIPGSECAGYVTAVGGGGSDLQIGNPVCVLSWGGVVAESICVPRSRVNQLPPGMPMDEGAVFRVAYSTAYHALRDRAALKPGEVLLVLGAAGSTGQAAVELGKAMGATVVAAASSDAKRNVCHSLGADHVVDSEQVSFRANVEEKIGRSAVDVIFDPVGGRLGETAFRLMAWGGRYCAVGFASGVIPKIGYNLPLLKGAALVGVNVGRLNEREPQRMAANFDSLLELYNNGKIRPRVTHYFSFDDVTAAYRFAMSGEATGRIVLTTGNTGKNLP